MPLMPDAVADFVTNTLSNFKKYKITDISLPLAEYVAGAFIDSNKVIEDGGPDIRYRVKVRNPGLAKSSGFYAVEEVGIEDLFVGATVPWTKQSVSWSFDVDEDIFQSDNVTIIKQLLMREQAAMCDMAELMEQHLWTAPSSSSDNRPMGIPFWLQKDATTTPEGGFNGGNPTGFTSGCAGISSTTYSKFRNYTFGYTSVTSDDLVRKVKKALWSTRFIHPVPTATLDFGKSNYQIFTNYDVQEPLERLAESRNDNLGNDVARYMNSVTIGGVPVRAVPYLQDNDSTDDTLYGVNLGVFRPFVKKNANMVRSTPLTPARQPTVRNVFMRNWMNYICYDRRKCWVGSK